MKPILDVNNFQWLMDEIGVREPERGRLRAICVQGLAVEQLSMFLDLTPEAVAERLNCARRAIAGHAWQHPLVQQKELLLRLLHNCERRLDHVPLGLDAYRSGPGAPAYGDAPVGAARVITGYDLAFGERSWRKARFGRGVRDAGGEKLETKRDRKRETGGRMKEEVVGGVGDIAVLCCEAGCTRRETAVMARIAAGRLLSEAARDLGISVHAVECHSSNGNRRIRAHLEEVALRHAANDAVQELRERMEAERACFRKQDDFSSGVLTEERFLF